MGADHDGAGSIAISGFPPRGRHPANLEATNPLVMWAYTNLSDNAGPSRKIPHVAAGFADSEAQKLGMFNANTWGAYILNGEAFIKRAHANSAETYPDFGCSFETFTNNEFLELETLGPLTKVPPEKRLSKSSIGASTTRSLTALTDEAIDAAIQPLLRESTSTAQD